MSNCTNCPLNSSLIKCSNIKEEQASKYSGYFEEVRKRLDSFCPIESVIASEARKVASIVLEESVGIDLEEVDVDTDSINWDRLSKDHPFKNKDRSKNRYR